MYCSKCGEADQNVNSYCRKCGNFLLDNSSKFSLINQFLGIESPQKQVKVGMIMNIISFSVSFLLLFFLMGYGMGAELATGKPSPNKGKKQSDETKKKVSEGLKRYFENKRLQNDK